jgi:hypothetical protein
MGFNPELSHPDLDDVEDEPELTPYEKAMERLGACGT